MPVFSDKTACERGGGFGPSRTAQPVLGQPHKSDFVGLVSAKDLIRGIVLAHVETDMAFPARQRFPPKHHHRAEAWRGGIPEVFPLPRAQRVPREYLMLECRSDAVR